MDKAAKLQAELSTYNVETARALRCIEAGHMMYAKMHHDKAGEALERILAMSETKPATR